MIQSVIGSYVEPRLSGTALSMSLFVVLFSIFLWGLSGTFIGVPITVAALTFCAHHPDTRWLAVLFGPPVCNGLALGGVIEVQPGACI